MVAQAVVLMVGYLLALTARPAPSSVADSLRYI